MKNGNPSPSQKEIRNSLMKGNSQIQKAERFPNAGVPISIVFCNLIFKDRQLRNAGITHSLPQFPGPQKGFSIQVACILPVFSIFSACSAEALPIRCGNALNLA